MVKITFVVSVRAYLILPVHGMLLKLESKPSILLQCYTLMFWTTLPVQPKLIQLLAFLHFMMLSPIESEKPICRLNCLQAMNLEILLKALKLIIIK